MKPIHRSLVVLTIAAIAANFVGPAGAENYSAPDVGFLHGQTQSGRILQIHMICARGDSVHYRLDTVGRPFYRPFEPSNLRRGQILIDQMAWLDKNNVVHFAEVYKGFEIKQIELYGAPVNYVAECLPAGD